MCSVDFWGGLVDQDSLRGLSCDDGFAGGAGGLMATGAADKSWFPSGRRWLNCGNFGVEVDGIAALWPRLNSASVTRRMPKAGETAGAGGGGAAGTFSGSRGNGLTDGEGAALKGPLFPKVDGFETELMFKGCDVGG